LEKTGVLQPGVGKVRESKTNNNVGEQKVDIPGSKKGKRGKGKKKNPNREAGGKKKPNGPTRISLGERKRRARINPTSSRAEKKRKEGRGGEQRAVGPWLGGKKKGTWLVDDVTRGKTRAASQKSAGEDISSARKRTGARTGRKGKKMCPRTVKKKGTHKKDAHGIYQGTTTEGCKGGRL